VEEALLATNPGDTVLTADFMEIVSPLSSRITHSISVHWVRTWPASYGLVYHASRDAGAQSWSARWLSAFGLASARRFVSEARPDVVVSLHPVPTTVLGRIRAQGALAMPLSTIITDHAVHNRWYHPGVDRYFAPDESVAQSMVDRGVPAARIVVSGIPVRSSFGKTQSGDEARERLGLNPGVFTVLVMVGAFGMMQGAMQVVEALATLPRVQTIVLAGHDGILAARLTHRWRDAGTVRVLNFTDDVATLMAAADLLVTKAGGVTVSEALAVGLPMIIYKPIPGQEAENTQYLLRNDAATTVQDPGALQAQVSRCMREPACVMRMRSRAMALGRPGAATAVVLDLHELAHQPARANIC
jgi:processive 1,2-diacylglycerol beta-glucosyltransferase